MSYLVSSHSLSVAEPEPLAPSLSPARLRGTAHLYGVETAPLDRARVLALGCGSGEGLLPFAVAYPEAQAVGVDASEALIAQGASIAQDMGLKNLTLYVGNPGDLGTQLGLFDYIIVSGMYGYLSPDSAQELLAVCATLLSPQGLLYLDSPVYPGAKSLDVVRDAIMLHGHAARTDEELRQSALAALTLFKNGMSASNPQRTQLSAAASHFERTLNAGPANAGAQRNPLANTGCYFVELAGRASTAGLAYVGDARPMSEIPLNFGQGVSLNHSLLTMGQPATVRQQYLDFATGRAFRQCLWVSQDRAGEVLAQPDLTRLQHLRFAAGLTRLAGNGPDRGVTYVNGQDRGLTTVDPDLINVVDLLAHAWPASLPYTTLLAVLLHKNQWDDATGRKALEKCLRTLLEEDLLNYCLDASPYERAGDAPLRLLPCLDLKKQAETAAPWPTFNLWHERIRVTASAVQASILRTIAAGLAPQQAKLNDTPVELGEVASTLALIKRYGLADGSTRAWFDLLHGVLVATERKAPVFGMYVAAQTLLNLQAGLLTQSGHQPNPGPTIIPQAKQLHELMTRQAYLEAEPIARRLTKAAPKFWDAWEALAITLLSTGRVPDAVLPAMRMIELAPADAQSYIVLAVAMARLGRTAESIAAGRRAIELAPASAEAHSALASGLATERRYKEAEESNRTAISLDPMHRKAWINLAKTLIDAGDASAAERVLQEALVLFPQDITARNNRMFALNYSVDKTAEEIFAAYQTYDREVCVPLRKTWREHKNPKVADRRLRIGYVSPDFRKHSGNNFLEPVLIHHDRQAFELTAYAELDTEDEVTTRLRTYFDHWVPTLKLTDAELAEKIRADGIDILIDLAGHTQGNKLSVFARKPAPVSLTWMGYGYTTGLSAIDYIVMDDVMAPEGSEHLFSEKIWRLKPGCPYRPGEAMGEVNELPALSAEGVTFGTLSRAIRINHRTIRTWAAILRRLPTARLVVNSGSYRDAAMADALAARFEAQGVSRNRLLIGFNSPPWDVLRSIDIGLDCFPHNSGVTLVEFIQMGVPFVSLADRPSVGRVGSSILSTIGHPEWICETEDEYVEKAVSLATDLSALAEIRRNLRQDMRNSALMDEVGFTRRFETDLRKMFTQWCETQA